MSARRGSRNREVVSAQNCALAKIVFPTRDFLFFELLQICRSTNTPKFISYCPPEQQIEYIIVTHKFADASRAAIFRNNRSKLIARYVNTNFLLFDVFLTT
jgi:hypothetical protein